MDLEKHIKFTPSCNQTLQVIGHNRTNIRQNDNGSGGVGLFIKNYLYEIYEISVFDRSFRDILLVQFKDKNSDYLLVVCVYYLPPENNIIGRLSQEFFDYLTNTIFRLNDFDLCLYLGDVNARCGRESDVVAVIDGNRLPDRRIIDETQKYTGSNLYGLLKVGELLFVKWSRDSGFGQLYMYFTQRSLSR